MTTRILKLLALLSLIAPLAANAMSIVYDVNRIIGAGSVTGTITTNGTIGALSSGDITGFSLLVNDGTDSFVIDNLAGAVANVNGTSLVASATAITFNFAAGSSENVEIVTPTVFGDQFSWIMRGSGREDIVHLFIAPTAITLVHQILDPITGVQVVATVQPTSLAEPGTLGLTLVALAGLGFVSKRKRRQAASV